jgi:hypothetical protein
MEILKYLSMFIILTTIGILYDKYKSKFDIFNEMDNNDKIKKYLLNENSILHGKPIIWVHNKYDINSRNWLTFMSRNSKELNQPYLNTCLETIIKHNGDSFNICLIDDESFEKLIPGWTISINELSDPVKTHIRNLALVKLLYYYGGMVVPSSFLAVKNFKETYNKLLSENDCFAAQMINRTNSASLIEFFPCNKMMGCVKNSANMKKIMHYLEKITSNDFTNEYEFEGKLNKYLFKLSKEGGISICESKIIGVKDNDNKPILIENLLENNHISFDKNMIGIYIPADNILKRTKYQWFGRLNKRQILEANTIISKFILLSLGK